MGLRALNIKKSQNLIRGFTIVEILIVVVVIGILAAISLVAYSGIQSSAAKAVLQSDLRQASKQLDLERVSSGGYPNNSDSLDRSSTTNFEYTGGGASYCLTAWSEAAMTSFHISNIDGSVKDGPCEGHFGLNGPPEVQGVVTTFAGSGVSGYADGNGVNAQFNQPAGLAVDSADYLYVVDMTNRRIRKITPSGEVTTLAGSGVSGSIDGVGAAAGFSHPMGMAIDSSDNLYVVDFGSHRIRKITPGGVVTTLAGSNFGFAEGVGADAKFWSPYDVAVDSADNVYVADSSNHRIRKITPSGVVSTFAGSGESGNAGGGYIDGSGDVAMFSYPRGIAVDSEDNIYVADVGNGRIRKISPSGVVTTLAGSGTYGYADGAGATARFAGLGPLAVDSFGNVYAPEDVGSRIRKISQNGTVTTLAGSGTNGYIDGTGVAALFNRPHGIAINSTGKIYVSDRLNHRIRIIE